MPSHEPGVDTDVAIETPEVVGEGFPRPVGAMLKGRQRHAFYLSHHAAQVITVARAKRRQREAAVAANDGSDAVNT